MTPPVVGTSGTRRATAVRDAVGGHALGIAAAVGLGLAAAIGAASVPGLPAAPIALLAGVVVSALGAGSVLATGAQWAASRLLRFGVMLLGAQLSLQVALALGAPSALLIVGVLLGVFGLTHGIGARLGIPADLRMLVAAGIGICGNSAIAAVAPIVRAPREHVTVAVGIITLTGTVSVVLYPVLGAALELSQADFGRWAGIAIADTGQVLAASLAYGSDATDTATVTKLIRNAFIGPVAVAISLHYSIRAGSGALRGISATTAVPPFVIGFIVLAALRTLGVIDPTLGDAAGSVGTVIILIGLAGIGLVTRLETLKAAGASTLLFGTTLVVVLSATTLVLLSRL